MARSLGEILRRFRPALAPGPAAPSGVPADRVAEAEAELAPVFAAIAPVIAHAHGVIHAAGEEAERRRRAAAEAAQEALAAGRARLDAERAEAAERRWAEVNSDRAKVEAVAAAEAARVAATAEDRMAGLVSAVIDAVWATADTGPGS